MTRDTSDQRLTDTGRRTVSVSFPGFPVPDFPGSRRLFHSRFPGIPLRGTFFLSDIFGIFHQMLRICLKIHNYVHEITCKEPSCTIQCQPILHFGILESGLFNFFYVKIHSQDPGNSREMTFSFPFSREWHISFPVETLRTVIHIDR
jgi:hypothetical protein